MAGKVVVLKVDTEREQQLSANYDIRSILFFAIFTGGQLRWRQAGLLSQRQMEQLLPQWLNR